MITVNSFLKYKKNVICTIETNIYFSVLFVYGTLSCSENTISFFQISSLNLLEEVNWHIKH